MSCELSIVIPCYKSENGLPSLLEALVPVAKSLTEHFEILLVNDRSPDNTWDVINQLAGEYPQIVPVDLACNGGQQVAVLCGIDQAVGEIVVTMDDDLQHRPTDIPKLILALAEADIVIARFDDKEHGLMRKIGSYAVRKISYFALGKHRNIRFSSFRAFPLWIARAASKYHVPSPVVGYTLLKVSDSVANVTLEHSARQDGNKSSYQNFQLVSYFLTILFTHSQLPLQFVSLLSLATAGIAFPLSGIYFLLGFLGHTTMSGFTTVVVLLTMFFAIIFSSVGILGMYVAQVMRVAEKKPLYTLRQRPQLAILERIKNKRAG